MHRKEGLHNLKFLGSFSFTRKYVLTNRLIKEALRIIDANEIECKCAKTKFGNQVDFVDVEARNAF